MPSTTQTQSDTAISTTILSPDGQPRAFHRINIEYYALFNNTNTDDLYKAVAQGMKFGLLATTKQRENAAKWRNSYNQSFKILCDRMVSNIDESNNQLPYEELRELSQSTDIIKEQLIKSPNDYLRHFHLAWLYLSKNDLKQAEVHFNIAALQSQQGNPDFACFALRHLAEIRYRNRRYPQALLAIKTARALSTQYDAELHFEYVRMLSLASRTSESLKQLSLLVNKAPYYKCIASIDPDLKRNPSFKRFFKNLAQYQRQKVLNSLKQQWENDPLNLLDLDKELGIKNSLKSIKQKQINAVDELPKLLLCSGKKSAELIHQQSRQFVLNTLDARKQNFIQNIEQHQDRAFRIHKAGQWFIYSSIVAVAALVLSYVISTIAKAFNHNLVVNESVQTVVLIVVALLVLIGVLLLHFTPTKLKTLLRKKKQLEQLSSKLGLSTG